MTIINIPNIVEPNDGDECFPEIIFINGNQNLIVRYVDKNGIARAVYEYKRVTANVSYFNRKGQKE